MSERILLVDDEPRVLDGLRRSLHHEYNLSTATSGAEALEQQQAALADGTPFAVLVSDMMMPGMNGAQFLARARDTDPDCVRIVLSGQADLASTISAVNSAGLFRFLTKPCEPDELRRTLNDALEQHRLIHAERNLLDRTLSGIVSVLTDVMAVLAPEAFDRTKRIRTLCASACHALEVDSDWQLPLVTMLSQLGCVSVPGPVLHQVQTGAALSDAEQRMYLEHPHIAAQLLIQIPRLENVAAWIGRQPLSPDSGPSAAAEPIEQALAAATAFLAGYEQSGDAAKTADIMKAAGHFPAAAIDAMAETAHTFTRHGTIRDVSAHDTRPGMIPEHDVLTTTGMVLVREGERLNDTLTLRLHHFAETVGVVEPLTVLDGT